MSLKTIAEKTKGVFSNKRENTTVEDVDNIEEYSKILSLSFIESMNQFLYGMYVAHQRINEEPVLDAEEFINEMKNIPQIDDIKEQKEYLQSNKIKIGKFLYWYLYE